MSTTKSIVTSLVTSVIVVVLALISFGPLDSSKTDSVDLGSQLEATRIRFGKGFDSADSIRIGVNRGQIGTPLKKLIATSTCSLIEPTAGQLQSASTTFPYDCFVLGSRSGDIVRAWFGTSTSLLGLGWNIIGADASTTNDYITVRVANLSGKDATVPREIASSTKAIIYNFGATTPVAF